MKTILVRRNGLTALVALLAGASLLASCGGGGDSSDPPALSEYSIGGVASGLSAAGLVLQNNGADALNVGGSGPFTFTKRLQAGAAYTVTVAAQPIGQTCTVANGSGTANSSIANVVVSCSDVPPAPPTMSVVASLATQADVVGAEVDGLWFEFDRPVQADTVDASTLKIDGPLGTVPGSYEVSSNGLMVRFRSNWPMYVGEEYRGTVSGVKGREGEDLSAPTTVSLRVPAHQMVAGSSVHLCALRSDGRVVCWGDRVLLGTGSTEHHGDLPNTMGAALQPVDLGQGESGVPLQALEVVATAESTCARLDGGQVKCWGGNLEGKLGIGVADPAVIGAAPGQMGDALPAVNLGTGRRALQLAGGESHVCALLDDGSLKCWGANHRGQLGQGDAQDRGTQPSQMGDALRSIDLGPARRAVQVSAGANHTCAVLDDATLKCWGNNSAGQLGLGETATHRGDEPGSMGGALPAVNLGGSIARVSAGGSHTCALLQDRALKCWGNNHTGALGLGDSRSRGTSPQDMGQALPAVDLGEGRHATAMRAGRTHTCVLLDSGLPACWGGGGPQLGLESGATPRGTDPTHMGQGLATVLLPETPAFRAIETSATQHTGTCAWRVNEQLWCWGGNGAGQLGQGYSDPFNVGDKPGSMVTLFPIDLGPPLP